MTDLALLPAPPRSADNGPASIGQVIRAALLDGRVRERYEAKVVRTSGDSSCHFWTGALHSKTGHARFWVGSYRAQDGSRHDVCMIGHRFGWAMVHGVAALCGAPVLAHECDESSCQNPDHLRPTTQESNRSDYQTRRWLPGSPLRDVRGPGGRARAIRKALRTGADVRAAMADGMRLVDEDQLLLW